MGLHSKRTACVRDAGKKKTQCASCPAQPRAFSLPGKTEAQRGLAPGKNRVRARLKYRYKHGARLARRSRACVRGCFLLSFAFSCLAFASQNSFHLSLRPRRASTFFRKESRQRFARGRGSAPFEPPFQRPAAVLSFFRAAGRLSGPSGRKPPADRETLEKPRSKAQLFKRFCAWGTRRGFCPRRVSSRPQGTGGGLSPRPGKQEPCAGAHPKSTACVRDWAQAQTRCATCSAQPRAFSPPGKTGARRGPTPENNRVRARLGAGTNPVRVLPTAGVLTAGAGERRFFHRRRRGSSGRSGGRCGPCTRRGRAPRSGGRDRCPPRAG